MQLWAIRPVGNGSDEYTIRNYMGGSYLQLGGSTCGTLVRRPPH